MRKALWIVLIMACLAGSVTSQAFVALQRPNIILIVVDDQSYRMMEDMINSSNPVTQFKSNLIDKGITFTNAYVTNPKCCPSRATMLTGKYPHNHLVIDNVSGYATFRASGLDMNTIAAWLSPYYYSGMIGKYLNGFPVERDTSGNLVDIDLTRPHGWSEWHPWFPGTYKDSPTPDENYPLDPFPNDPDDPHFPQEIGKCSNEAYDGDKYYNFFLYSYRVQDAFGQIVCYAYDSQNPSAVYSTTVMTDKALAFVDSAQTSGKPFFLYLAPFAPHQPAEPHPFDTEALHPDWFSDVSYPLEYAEPNGAFNEQDVSDKPSFIADNPLLNPAEVNRANQDYHDMLRTMYGVDRMIDTLIDYLIAKNLIKTTYIIYVADNGMHFGDHRLDRGRARKGQPYETDIRVPLIIRGPDIPRGVTRNHLVINTDLAPTIADLARVPYDHTWVDGTSFLPLLSISPPDQYAWRGRFAIVGSEFDEDPNIKWQGVRVNQRFTNGQSRIVIENRMYVERLSTAEYELYNLIKDPYQLENQFLNKTSVVGRLRGYLDVLLTCSGQLACQSAEGFNILIPLPPATNNQLQSRLGS